jgi:WD40 repeat protein
MITGSADNDLKLWDPMNFKEITSIKGFKEPVNWVRFSVDGTNIAAASNDESIKIWDTRTYKLLNSIQRKISESLTGLEKSRVNCVEYSQDGRFLISTNSNGDLIVYDSLKLIEVAKQPVETPARVIKNLCGLNNF